MLLNDHQSGRDGSRWLWRIAFAGVTGLGGCAFALSFSALRDLAVRSGIEPGLAYMWPLIVDGFIVVATAAAFALRGQGPRVTWYPWAALVVFSAVSVCGNALHAQAQATDVATWLSTIVSAVPAVALLLASHLMTVIAENSRTAPAPVDVTARDRTTPDPIHGPTDAVPAPAAERGDAWSPGGPAGPSAASSLVDQLRQRAGAGEPITAALIAELQGVSVRTGRRRLEAVRREAPDLFDIPGDLMTEHAVERREGAVHA